MGALGCCLVGPPEDRPSEDVLDRQLPLSEFQGEPADFLDGPSNEFLSVLNFEPRRVSRRLQLLSSNCVSVDGLSVDRPGSYHGI